MSKAKIPAVAATRSCVLVLGMHRSGTSALAGALSKLGCELPAHSMVASKSNPKGFFESTQVRDFNDELLASAGSAWDDVAHFPEEWLRSPIANEFIERAVSLLEGEFGNAPLFVLKDPRICRLVPFWMASLERFGCVVKPILIARNPLDVSRSLLTKRGFSEPTGEILWLRHVLDAEHATRGMERFHTSFDQLMLAWETVAMNAQDSLGLVWPKSIANAEFEVAEFLSSDLRHHRDISTRALTSPLLPSWLRETYEILNAWAEGGERAEDYEKLDQIRLEFDVACNVFARLVRAERVNSAEPRLRVREVEAEGKRIQAELDGMVHKSKEQTASYENDRALLESALANGRSEIVRLEHQLTVLAAEAEEQRTALEEAIEEQRAIHASVEKESEERRSKLEQAMEDQKAAFAVLQSESEGRVENLKDSLQEQRRRNTLMAADLHQLEEELETLRAQLRDAQAELAASRARRKEMAQVIARRDAAIEARYRELATLELQLLHSSWLWKAKEFWRKLRYAVRRQLERSSRPETA